MNGKGSSFDELSQALTDEISRGYKIKTTLSRLSRSVSETDSNKTETVIIARQKITPILAECRKYLEQVPALVQDFELCNPSTSTSAGSKDASRRNKLLKKKLLDDWEKARQSISHTLQEATYNVKNSYAVHPPTGEEALPSLSEQNGQSGAHNGHNGSKGANESSNGVHSGNGSTSPPQLQPKPASNGDGERSNGNGNETSSRRGGGGGGGSDRDSRRVGGGGKSNTDRDRDGDSRKGRGGSQLSTDSSRSSSGRGGGGGGGGGGASNKDKNKDKDSKKQPVGQQSRRVVYDGPYQYEETTGLLAQERRQRETDLIYADEEEDEEDPQQQAHMKLQHAIAIEREDAVKRVEKDVRKVGTMFQDLQSIVQSHQPHIDTIETKVIGTRENAKAGLSHLNQASQRQKTSRGRMCCMAFCLLLSALVFTVFITSFLQR